MHFDDHLCHHQQHDLMNLCCLFGNWIDDTKIVSPIDMENKQNRSNIWQTLVTALCVMCTHDFLATLRKCKFYWITTISSQHVNSKWALALLLIKLRTTNFSASQNSHRDTLSHVHIAQDKTKCTWCALSNCCAFHCL